MENSQIEQQDLNVEIEVNEEKVVISEKSDKLMKRSITYLKIGFWTFLVILSGSVISAWAQGIMFGGMGGSLIGPLFVWCILGFLLTKMYAYIAAYKVFRATKTQQALENLLKLQKGYYGWVYLLPLIVFSIAFVILMFGNHVRPVSYP